MGSHWSNLAAATFGDQSIVPKGIHCRDDLKQQGLLNFCRSKSHPEEKNICRGGGRGGTATQGTEKNDVSNGRNGKSKYSEMLHYLKVAYLQIPKKEPNRTSLVQRPQSLPGCKPRLTLTLWQPPGYVQVLSLFCHMYPLGKTSFCSHLCKVLFTIPKHPNEPEILIKQRIWGFAQLSPSPLASNPHSSSEREQHSDCSIPQVWRLRLTEAERTDWVHPTNKVSQGRAQILVYLPAQCYLHKGIAEETSSHWGTSIWQALCQQGWKHEETTTKKISASRSFRSCV